MFPHFDTCYAALKIERTVTLKRVERQAPLLEAAKEPVSVAAGNSTAPRLTRWDRVARALRSVRWSLRPSHA
jgi:hypothetical protein